MMMKRPFAAAVMLAAMMAAAMTAQAQVVINIDAAQKGAEVSPTHYGIFFEDINHAADGGLYAELVRNRSFEDNTMLGGTGVYAWSTVGSSKISLTQTNLLNDAQGNALSVVMQGAGDGVQNEGFWGMNVAQGTTYRLSFFARSAKKYKGTMTATLVSHNGKALGSTTVKMSAGGKWQKYQATITATGSDPKAQLRLTGDRAGEVQLDVVSLFPPTFKDRENGMRPDLAQMLADMHPRFMRFPGGCFVEGERTPDNAFRWKRTIGPIEQRPGHENVNWGYRTSDGIGFHEYLQLAEDLGAKPLFVVNVGIWHGGCDPYDKIDSWIEECLDALEYANGDVTTRYGKMRAEAGHPEPFGLEYIEIGNENYNFHMDSNRDQSDHYPERYIQFYRAIKAKYPYVKCIGNVESWGTDNPSWRNEHPVDMVDEHYYRNPKWFADRFNKYDSYPRGQHKVYVGEYAVTNMFGTIGNLNAALGEAVYMMGMENNSDVVAMNSYAPIFVNENDARWRPDMIRFNSAQSMGTPSYYVQQMFPNNIGTRVVKTDWTYNLTMPQHDAKQTQPVQVGLATWGTQVQYRNAQLIVDGQEHKIDDYARWQIQSGEWVGRNGSYLQTSAAQPSIAVCPQQIAAGKRYTYKVEACKTGGAEGFLMMFGYKNADTYGWYNIGGWGNAVNNVEQVLGSSKVQLARDRQFSVENDRWYTLQVDVEGDSVRCYIDGQLDFACRMHKSLAMEGVYASTTIDEATGMMYVKVVNVGEGHADGIINLQHCRAQSVSLLRLASASGDDENTLDAPHNITPVEGTAALQDDATVRFQVQPFSVNILRIKIE